MVTTLYKTIEHVLKFRDNIIAGVVTNNTVYKRAIFDAPGMYEHNKKEVACYEIAEYVSIDGGCPEEWLECDDKDFKDILVNWVLNQLDNNNKVYFFLDRAKVTEEQSKEYKCPLEFYYSIIIYKDSNDLVIKYILEDDDNNLIITNNNIERLIKEISLC